MQKRLLVGLGNVGEEYTCTRHNIGFLITDHIVKEAQGTYKKVRMGRLATLGDPTCRLYVLQPGTYMNRSGEAFSYWLRYLNIATQETLTITDDIRLLFGKLRLRSQGGHGGHNGLRNISEQIASSVYPRLRFGVGNNFAPGQQAAYVLGRFTATEQTLLPEKIIQAAEIASYFGREGIVKTMNHYNGQLRSDQP